MCSCGGMGGWLQGKYGLVRCECNPPLSKDKAPLVKPGTRSPAINRRANQVTYSALKARRTAEKFMVFHRDNPHVYEEIVRRALIMINNGASSIGMKDIVEDMRRSGIKTKGDKYGLNNTYAPVWALIFKRENKQFENLIETRASEIARIAVDELGATGKKTHPTQSAASFIVAHSPQEQAGVSAAPSRAALPQGHSSF